MRKYGVHFVYVMFFLSFFILFHGFLFADSTYEGKKINDVEFKGLVKTDLYSVKGVIETKAKSSFSQKMIDSDIKALYNLDLFDDIKVDVEEQEDGIVVTFIFVELPTIRDIDIKGNKKVKDRAIKDEILMKSGSVFHEYEIDSEVEKIIALFEEKGFPDTEVSYEIKQTKEKDKKTGEKINTVDVIFLVNESKKLVIRTINFSGVESFDIDKIKSKMKTRERGYLLSRGFFKEDQFELDKREILRYYGSYGYIDAEIIKIDKNIVKDEERNRNVMDLTIYIKEGNQYTFGGVGISGNKIFTDDELYPLIKLKENEVFDKTVWESGVQSIRSLLATNGYIYSSVIDVPEKDIENNVISYSIQITENIKAHIENIFVKGNEKTKKFVIERELEILEGEIFNTDKILRSISKLYNLQYFSTIYYDIKQGTELGLVDLIFLVEEQRTGLFSFGLSYSTAGYGISLFEEVSANNFLGRGLRLYEKVDIGFTHQAVELGLDEPWLFNTPTSAGITLSWSRTEYGEEAGDLIYTWNLGNYDAEGNPIPDGVEEVDGTYDYTNADSMDYVNQTIKLALRLGRRFGSYYGINGELGFSIFRNYSGSDDIPFDESLREQYQEGWPWYWKNYLSLTGYRDTRDSRIFATRGYLLSQNIGFYGGPLGGYSNFLRLVTDTNINVRTFWNFVLSARLNFGFIYPWLGLNKVIDDTDYLRVDCWNEGRGWQRPSVQSFGSQSVGSLYSVRGESELNFSLEHRFPIEKRLLWGITFFDLSGIYSSPEAFSIDFKDFYYSIGLGVGLVIPGFPIRFYLTRRFAYDKELDKFQLANSQSFFRDWDFVFAVAGFF